MLPHLDVVRVALRVAGHGDGEVVAMVLADEPEIVDIIVLIGSGGTHISRTCFRRMLMKVYRKVRDVLSI